MKLYRKPESKDRKYSKPDPIVTPEGAEEYEVDEIVRHQKQRRGKQTKLEYLVFWKGYPAHEATWEPVENLQNAPEKVEEYYRRVEGNTVLKEGSM